MTIGEPNDEQLAAFHAGIYLDAFAARREPLEAWLRARRGEARYTFEARVALDDDGAIAGGIVFERYPGSGCGLVTYLVVASAMRRRGLGKRLLDVALAALGDTRAVFGETEEPARFVRWGARVVDARYVQPSLGPGLPRGTGLVLIDFTGRAERAVAWDLVRELYEVTEGVPPEPW